MLLRRQFPRTELLRSAFLTKKFLESPHSLLRECYLTAPKIFRSDTQLRSKDSIYLSLMHRKQDGPMLGALK